MITSNISYHPGVYAIAGAHCTGKTTVSNMLLSKLEILGVSASLYNSLYTNVKQLETQHQVARQYGLIAREAVNILHLRENLGEQVIVKDRCILDTYIYSKYFYEIGKLTAAEFETIQNLSMEIILSKPYTKTFIFSTTGVPFIERNKFTMLDDSREPLNRLFLDFQQTYSHLDIVLVPEGSEKQKEEFITDHILCQ